MGTSLTGKNISASYLGLLKTTDNAIIGSTAKRLTDGGGTDSPLYLSTTQLGIGVSPMTKLHVQGTDVTSSPSAEQLIVAENNGNTAIGIFSSLTGQGSIDFGDSADNNAGRILYEHNDNNLSFSTNGSRKMSILSDGKIGIGTSTVTSGYDVDVLSSGGDARILLRPSSNDEASYQLGNSSGDILTHFATSNGSSIINHAVGTGTLQLKTNASKAIEIDSSQNIQFNAYGSGTITGTATQRLGVDSSGNVIEIPIGAGAVDGSGATGQASFWTDSDTISGDSGFIWDNTNKRLGIGTTTPARKFVVSNGAASGIEIQPNYVSGVNEILSFNRTTAVYETMRLNGGDFQFQIGGSEIARLDSSGRLGLGTTSPYAKLHLSGSSSQNIVLTNTGADGNTGTTISSIIGQARGYGNDGAVMQSIDFETNSSTWYKGDIVFKTNNTDGTDPSVSASERMRIDSSGNVGIGTDSPSDEVHISKSQNGTTTLQVQNANTGTGARANLHLQSDASRIDLYATSSTYNGVASWIDAGVINTSTASSGGLILNSQAGGIKFQIGTNEKIRLDSSGNLGLGVSSPNRELEVSGNGTAGTQIQVTGTQDSAGIKFVPVSGNQFEVQASTSSEWFVYDRTNNAYRLRINSSGNVGINDTVSGNFTTNYDTKLLVGGEIIARSLTANESMISIGGDSTSAFIKSGKQDGSLTDRALRFVTGEDERMRIDSSGDVTIQTSGADDIKNFTINSSNGASQVAGFVIQNDGANGYVHFKAGAGGATPTTKLTIGNAANSGNVGIGTTSPADKFVVKGGSAGNADLVSFQNSNGNETHRFYADSDNDGVIETVTNAGTTANLIQSSGSSYFNGGNVGIGETSPLVPLHISRDSASGENIALILDNNDTTAGNEIGMLFRTMVGSTNTDFEIFGKANGANDMDLVFQSDGSVERMRITSGGDIGIGTTSPNNKMSITGYNEMTLGFPALSGGASRSGIKPTVTGAGAGQLEFLVGGDNNNEATTVGMAIDSSGNVGIGTTSPAELLTLNKASGAVGILLEGNGTDVGKFKVSSAGVNHSVQIGTISNNEMQFHTNDSEKMRIHQDGNVGIGTTSPATKLDVNSGISSSSASVISISQNTTGAIKQAAAFGVAIQNGGESTNASDLFISTASGGSLSERMRITSGGNVLVGKTTDDDNTTGARIANFGLLSASRAGNVAGIFNRSSSEGNIILFRQANTEVGTISVTSSATAYNTSSDYRLKEDLQDFNALEIASKIKMYDFKWKADDSRSYGVMAHELEEVLPQAVTGEKDAEEMQSVDYSKLVPILLKGMQEQQAMIEELKAEIDELKKNK